MNKKIKDGYNLFIKKNSEGDLVGTLTLKESENDYKDIVHLELSDMRFVNNYNFINKSISDVNALFISFDKEENKFFVSLQEKATMGEYNDVMTWNNIIVSKKHELEDSLNRLNQKIEIKTKEEVLIWKKI